MCTWQFWVLFVSAFGLVCGILWWIVEAVNIIYMMVHDPLIPWRECAFNLARPTILMSLSVLGLVIGRL